MSKKSKKRARKYGTCIPQKADQEKETQPLYHRRYLSVSVSAAGGGDHGISVDLCSEQRPEAFG